MKKLIVVIMLLGGGIIFSSNANKPIENIASKPTTADKYIFTAVESANYGTATG